jgi:hypothetical protein
MPVFIDQTIYKEDLSDLVKVGRDNPGLFNLVNIAILGNQNDSFYDGLFSAYYFAANIAYDLDDANYRGNYTCRALTAVVHHLAEWLSMHEKRQPVLISGYFNQLVLICDLAVDDENIHNNAINARTGLRDEISDRLSRPFINRETPDFYRGNISGLANSYELACHGKNDEPLSEFYRQAVMFVAANVVKKGKI